MPRSIRIAMWSGPRNISTALMRSFENRNDSYVTDEPFYAYFLKNSGELHPEEIAYLMCDNLIGMRFYYSFWRYTQKQKCMVPEAHGPSYF